MWKRETQFVAPWLASQCKIGNMIHSAPNRSLHKRKWIILAFSCPKPLEVSVPKFQPETRDQIGDDSGMIQPKH